MNKTQKYITNLNFALLTLVLVLYIIIRFKVSFFKNIASGDEVRFLEIFNLYLQKGYSFANVYGNSILFNLTSGFINFFIDNPLMSLKTSSLLFGILCIVFLSKILKLKTNLSKYQKAIILVTSINALVISSVIFTAYNDVLLYFLTVLLFYFLEKINLIKHHFKLSVYLGVCFAAMFLVRSLATLYVIPFLMVFFHLHYKVFYKLGYKKVVWNFSKNIMLVSVISVILLALFNYPSLKEKQRLSFTNKEPNLNVNWTQRQYLSAIMVEKGALEFGQHMTWKQTENYVEENGPNSLPKSNIKSITFNFGATIKHTFFNIIYQIKPITRLLGILFVLFLMLKIIKLRTNFKFNFLDWDKILIFFIIYVLSICAIIFSYVEPRWYINMLVLLPIPLVAFIAKFKSEKNKKWFDFVFLNSQLLFLVVINLPFIIKNI